MSKDRQIYKGRQLDKLFAVQAVSIFQRPSCTVPVHVCDVCMLVHSTRAQSYLQAGIIPDASMAQVRAVLTEYAILPLG